MLSFKPTVTKDDLKKFSFTYHHAAFPQALAILINLLQKLIKFTILILVSNG